MAVTLLSSTGLAPRKNNLNLHIQKSVKDGCRVNFNRNNICLHEEKIKKNKD